MEICCGILQNMKKKERWLHIFFWRKLNSKSQIQYPNISAIGTLIRIKWLQQPWQLYQDEIPVLLYMPFLLCNHYSEDTFLHLPHFALSTLRFKSFSIFHSPPSQDSLISYGSYLGKRLRGVPVGGGEGYKTLDQSVPLNNITVLIQKRALIISTFYVSQGMNK